MYRTTANCLSGSPTPAHDLLAGVERGYFTREDAERAYRAAYRGTPLAQGAALETEAMRALDC